MWFPFSRYVIKGHSMEPAFTVGDRLIINRLSYIFKEPAADDIVAVRHPKVKNKILLKKIKKTIPEKQYFVVGTNSADSTDSRNFGPVSKEMIIGKVWFNY